MLGNTNHETKLTCANKSIPIANEMKLLVVTLDNKLKFDSHVAAIGCKVGGQVNTLNRLKNILPSGPAEAVQSWSGSNRIERRRRKYTRGVRGHAPPENFEI